MQRITVDVGMEAYRNTGLKPKQGHGDNGAVCGLQAALEAGLAEGLEFSYKLGFTIGFDGEPPCDCGCSAEGYEDGKALWEAVKDFQATGVPTPPDTVPIEWEEAVV